MESAEDAQTNIEDYNYLIWYCNKNVTLESIKDTVDVNSKVLQEKEKNLQKSEADLNNVQSKLINAKNIFCDKVSSFSLKHNFEVLYKTYPNIIEDVNINKCGCNVIISKNDSYIREDENVVGKLITEISTLEKKLLKLSSHINAIKQKIKESSSILHKLQSNSEEIAEFWRLIITQNTLTTSNKQMLLRGNVAYTLARGNCLNAEERLKPSNNNFQKQDTNRRSTVFIKAKDLLKDVNLSPRVVIRKEDMLSASCTLDGGSKQFADQKRNTKKFIMKKQSSIARKFGRSRMSENRH